MLSVSSTVSFGQVLNYKTEIEIKKNGKKVTKVSVSIKVNSKDENWMSHVEISHNPRQNFSLNYARILDGEGEERRELKKKELKTRSKLSNLTFYQDVLLTEFDLYWHQYPYTIEYSYEIEEKEYLYAAWWSPILFSNTMSMQSSLEVKIPEDYKVKILSTENLLFEEEKADNNIILKWRSNFVKMSKSEKYSPPSSERFPLVKIIPDEFKYGISGSTDSWSSFGGWLDELNEDSDDLTTNEKVKIDQLINGVGNRNEIIKILYYYLQDNTKYINVSIDVGGYKSFPASYVCTNKYGDCKALTTYMKSMLKYVGIESVYTIIKSGLNEAEIDTLIPSQQFNHAVLMIPSAEDTIWLENTSNSLPYNYVGSNIQNRYALGIDGIESKLVNTPSLSTEDVLIERLFTYKINESDQVDIDVDLVLRGIEFERFRYLYYKANEEKQIKEIEKRTGINDLDIRDWTLVDFDRDSTFLKLESKGVSNSVIRKIGDWKVIHPLKIKIPIFEKPKDRILDVRINVPRNISDTSIYYLSDLELDDVSIPDGIDIECKYGIYHVDIELKDAVVKVNEYFTLYANSISVEEYGDFYSFIDTIRSFIKNTAILIK